jgi:hypothetical protein
MLTPARGRNKNIDSNSFGSAFSITMNRDGQSLRELNS